MESYIASNNSEASYPEKMETNAAPTVTSVGETAGQKTPGPRGPDARASLLRHSLMEKGNVTETLEQIHQMLKEKENQGPNDDDDSRDDHM